MIKKLLASISIVLSFTFSVTACSPIRTAEQNATCLELNTFLEDISNLQNATAAAMSDGAMRRAGARLILSKLDEMESTVISNDAKLKPLVDAWIEKQRAIATEYRKLSILDIDNQLLDKTISEFKQANSELGTFCS